MVRWSRSHKGGVLNSLALGYLTAYNKAFESTRNHLEALVATLEWMRAQGADDLFIERLSAELSSLISFRKSLEESTHE